MEREFVVYDSSTTMLCVAIRSRQQPANIQHFMMQRLANSMLQFKGVIGQFDTVHEFLKLQQCFVGIDPSLLGIWVPSQRTLLQMYPQLGDRVLEAGKTSADAVVRLGDNPTLTFVIAERLSDRKTLSIASFQAEQIIKTMIVRVPQGYEIGKDHNILLRSTLIDLLIAAFGVNSVLTHSSPLVIKQPRSVAQDRTSVAFLAGPKPPLQTRNSGSFIAAKTFARSTDDKITGNEFASSNVPWMTQPVFESIQAVNNNSRVDNGGTADSAKSWHCYVRRSKLYDLEPMHRDLDGSPLSEKLWYHFTMSGQEASRLLDG